jgi:hypothetical protein
MACSVRASSATSSSAAGCGIDFDGSRVRWMSRAAVVIRAIGSIARRPSRTPPSSASRVPPRTPAVRKSRTRRMVASMSETLRPYCRTIGTTTRLGRPWGSTTLTGRLRTSTRRPANFSLRVG